jgi:hypothetical protein
MMFEADCSFKWIIEIEAGNSLLHDSESLQHLHRRGGTSFNLNTLKECINQQYIRKMVAEDLVQSTPEEKLSMKKKQFQYLHV